MLFSTFCAPTSIRYIKYGKDQKRLTCQAVLIYELVVSLTAGSKSFFASNAEIADFVACNERSVRNYLRELKESGLILITYSPDSNQRFIRPVTSEIITTKEETGRQILPGGVAKNDRGGGKICQGGWQNLPHKNINLINKSKDQSNLTDDDFKRLADQYKTDIEGIKEFFNNLMSFYEEKGKKIKYPLALLEKSLVTYMKEQNQESTELSNWFLKVWLNNYEISGSSYKIDLGKAYQSGVKEGILSNDKTAKIYKEKHKQAFKIIADNMRQGNDNSVALQKLSKLFSKLQD